MTPDRWALVREVFHGAAGLNHDERGAYLDRACEGEPELRAEVDRLLAADGVAGNFVEDTVLEAALAFDQGRGRPLPGWKIGPYRLAQEIGRGGMSTVFLALRDDDEYRQQVAIKLIRQELVSGDMLRRFRIERQILADLEHPHIAKLLDGGTTEDGLPYLVMEHVDGQRIDSYCQRLGLSIADRLRLLRDVAAAVHHAHQNLIVHRDLKPSNILVTADGVVKLVDFGIAAALEPSAEVGKRDGKRDATATAYRILTPGYASPEHLQGGGITTASDVYSLGVVLFELLTDRQPFDATELTPSELLQRICHQEPPRPSTVAPQLRRQLKGDLDNIVSMAMRKEPERRYSSGAELAEDLDRYQQGLPVRACEDGLVYRAIKLVRRQRLAAGLAATSLILLIALAFLATLAGLRVAAELDKAEAVVAFLGDLFEIADPAGRHGETVSARDILDHAVGRVDDELAGQDEIRAQVLSIIATGYGKLGFYDLARPHFEQALELRRSLFGEEHPAVAASLDDLAGVLYDQGNYAAAEPLLRRSLKQLKRFLGEDHVEVAAVLNDLGLLLLASGDLPAGETHLRQALAVRRRALGDDHLEVATTLHNLAVVRRGQADAEDSERLLRQVLDLRRRQLGGVHPLVASTLANLAETLQEKSEYEEAERLYRQAIEIDLQTLGDEHPDTAGDLFSLGYLLHAKGDHEAAEDYYRRSLKIYRKTLGDGHPYLAHPLTSLGSVLSRRGQRREAEEMLREALMIREKALPMGDWRIAETASVLGRVLALEGRMVEAEPLLRRAYRSFVAALGEEHAMSERVGEWLVSQKQVPDR